jgi:hypothetical protein
LATVQRMMLRYFDSRQIEAPKGLPPPSGLAQRPEDPRLIAHQILKTSAVHDGLVGQVDSKPDLVRD